MNLGTARIVIIVALVAAGIAVIANAFKPGTVALTPQSGGSTAASPSGSTTPSSSASHAPHPLPSPATTGDLVSVFNGIDAPNCAGTVSTMLLADGYRDADPPGDATTKPIAKTAVFYRQDPKRQNLSDATYMAAKYFFNARVAKLSSTFPGTVSSSAQVAVLIGNDYRSHCG